MSTTFMHQVKNRRSVYAIGKEEVVPYMQIESIIQDAVTHVPTAFNSQSGRVILLKNEAHQALWEQLKATLKAMLPPEQYEASATRIDGFAAGYGSVLFFEDQEVIQSLQENFALYKDNFPIWSQQANGMLQFVIWTALSEAGLGASLQHYNELIESYVKETFNLSAHWKLIAQMPFGNPVAAPSDKQFSPLASRILVI